MRRESGRPPKHDSSIRQKVQTRGASNQRRKAAGRRAPRRRTRTGPQYGACDVGCGQITTPPHPDFYLQSGSDFEAKLLDIVGLYLNPPENALVLCVEKPNIQALDRPSTSMPPAPVSVYRLKNLTKLCSCGD